MRRIAIYGKGGIGKSTVASHVAWAAAEQGMRVLQVGCSPKNDSTYRLLGSFPPTVLDVLRSREGGDDTLHVEDLVAVCPQQFASGGRVWCAESGGPEPGVGCGGKGVVEALETLARLEVYAQLQLDLVLYDILGDVVCGGFSLPIRQGYADEVIIVTSGEFEALYQVANVSRAIRRFARRSGARLAGLVVNLRGLAREAELVTAFARLLTTPIIGQLPFSQLVKECGGEGHTVFASHAASAEAALFRSLTARILADTATTIPAAISFEQLYEWWLGYCDEQEQ